VQFATLPIERYGTKDGQDVNIVDVAKVQKEVRVAFGLEPAAPLIPAAAPALTSTVDVLDGDGDGRPGLATGVSEALVGAGFPAGTIGASTADTTAVGYGPGAQLDAAAIASLLGGVVAAPDPALPAGHVSVVLGKGFSPAADLAQRAAALKNPPPAAATTTTDPSGPQGLPVDGSGIPCVD